MRLLSALALLLVTAVHADVYKWVDAQGRTHFSDKVPASAPASKVDVHINTFKADRSNVAYYSPSTLNEATDYYWIEPASSAGLQAELDRHSTIFEEGEQYFGQTTSRMGWRYHWREEEGRCRMTWVSTDLSIRFLMPGIRDRGAIKPDALAAYDSYYASLLVHERGHARISKAGATEVESTLKKMSASNCKELAEQADRIGNELLEKYSRLQTEYDRITRHGVAQHTADAWFQSARIAPSSS